MTRPAQVHVSPEQVGPVSCAVCGSTAPSQPLTWTTTTDPRGTTLICDRCTREHVRAMEARLDEEYW